MQKQTLPIYLNVNSAVCVMFHECQLSQVGYRIDKKA